MTNSGIFIYELNNHFIYCSNVHNLNFSAKNYGPENISWRYLWLVSIKDLNSKRIFVLNLECCQKKCCLKEILLPCNKFKKHWRNKLDILKSLHFLKHRLNRGDEQGSYRINILIFFSKLYISEFIRNLCTLGRKIADVAYCLDTNEWKTALNL